MIRNNSIPITVIEPQTKCLKNLIFVVNQSVKGENIRLFYKGNELYP